MPFAQEQGGGDGPAQCRADTAGGERPPPATSRRWVKNRLDATRWVVDGMGSPIITCHASCNEAKRVPSPQRYKKENKKHRQRKRKRESRDREGHVTRNHN